jgi:hypothetical protein
LHGALTAGIAEWRGSGSEGPLADEIRAAAAELGDLSGAADSAFAGS